MLIDKKIPISYIFNSIKFDLLYVVVVGIVVHYLSLYASNVIPKMPLTIPAFLGTAISILLSFKVNQSYDRWWEARKVWGAIVNDSRSFVVQLQSFIDDKTIIKKIAYRQIAWCYSLGQTLRNQNPLENLETYFDENDFKELNNHNNKPLGILQQNAIQITNLKQKEAIVIFVQLQLDNTLIRLCDAMGKAERIKNTVFPKTYRLFLHFAIYLFITILSIALDDIQLIFELPLLVSISMVFFLIDKSAKHMQDPFMNRPTDTSVTAIARTIEINIKQLLGEKDIAIPIQPNDFYIL